MLSKRGCFLLDGDSVVLEQVKAALVTSIHISTLAPPPQHHSSGNSSGCGYVTVTYQPSHGPQMLREGAETPTEWQYESVTN